MGAFTAGSAPVAAIPKESKSSNPLASHLLSDALLAQFFALTANVSFAAFYGSGERLRSAMEESAMAAKMAAAVM